MQAKKRGRPKGSHSVEKVSPAPKRAAAVASDPVEQLVQLLLGRLSGAVAPVQTVEPMAPLGFDAEAELFPAEASFGDEIDQASFVNSLGFNGQNWSSDHNPDFKMIDEGGPYVRKLGEDLMSFQGQCDAKFEMLSNRMKQIERYVGQAMANQVSAGRRR